MYCTSHFCSFKVISNFDFVIHLRIEKCWKMFLKNSLASWCSVGDKLPIIRMTRKQRKSPNSAPTVSFFASREAAQWLPVQRCLPSDERIKNAFIPASLHEGNGRWKRRTDERNLRKGTINWKPEFALSLQNVGTQGWHVSCEWVELQVFLKFYAKLLQW